MKLDFSLTPFFPFFFFPYSLSLSLSLSLSVSPSLSTSSRKGCAVNTANDSERVHMNILFDPNDLDDVVRRLRRGITLRQGQSAKKLYDSDDNMSSSPRYSLTAHHGIYGVHLPEFSKLLRSNLDEHSALSPADENDADTHIPTYTYDVALEDGTTIKGLRRYMFWVNLPPAGYCELKPGSVVMYRPGGVSDTYHYGVVNGPPSLSAEGGDPGVQDSARAGSHPGDSMVPICLVRTGMDSKLLSRLVVNSKELSDNDNHKDVIHDYVVSGGDAMQELCVKRSELQPMSSTERLSPGLEIKRASSDGPEWWCDSSIMEPLCEAFISECRVPLISRGGGGGEGGGGGGGGGGGAGGAGGAVDYDVVTAEGKVLRHCLPENLVSVRPGTRVSLAPDGWSWKRGVHIPGCPDMDVESSSSSSSSKRESDLKLVHHPTLKHGIVVQFSTPEDNALRNKYHDEVFPSEGSGPSKIKGSTCEVEMDNPSDRLDVLVVLIPPTMEDAVAAGVEGEEGVEGEKGEKGEEAGGECGSGSGSGIARRESDVDRVASADAIRAVAKRLRSIPRKSSHSGASEILGWTSRERMVVENIKIVSLSTMASRMDLIKDKLKIATSDVDQHALCVVEARSRLQEANMEVTKILDEMKSILESKEEDSSKKLGERTETEKRKCMRVQSSAKDELTKMLKEHADKKLTRSRLLNEYSMYDFSMYDGCVFLSGTSGTVPAKKLRSHGYIGEILTMVVVAKEENKEENEEEETTRIPCLRVDCSTNRTDVGGDGSTLYETVVASNMDTSSLMAPIVDYVRHRHRIQNINLDENATSILPLSSRAHPSRPPNSGDVTTTSATSATSSATSANISHSPVLRRGTVVWTRERHGGRVLLRNDGTYSLKEYGTGDLFRLDPEVDDIKSSSSSDGNRSMRELLLQARSCVRSVNLSSTSMHPMTIAADLHDFVRRHDPHDPRVGRNGGRNSGRNGGGDDADLLAVLASRPTEGIMRRPLGGEEGGYVMTLCGGFFRIQPMIQTLLLSNMNLGSKGIRLLCRGLLSNTSMTKLDISSNVMKDEGTHHVAQVLRRHPRLTSLNLSHNMLTGASSTLLATSISNYQIGTIVGITPQSMTVRRKVDGKIIHDVSTGAVLLLCGDFVYKQPKKDQYGRMKRLVLRRVAENQTCKSSKVRLHGEGSEEQPIVEVDRSRLSLPWRTINRWRSAAAGAAGAGGAAAGVNDDDGASRYRRLVRTTPVLGYLLPQMSSEFQREKYKVVVVEKRMYKEDDFSDVVKERFNPTLNDDMLSWYKRPNKKFPGKFIQFKEESWERQDGTCEVYEVLQDEEGNNVTFEIPGNEGSRITDPHDPDKKVEPSTDRRKLVAVNYESENVELLSVSRTFDVEYTTVQSTRPDPVAVPFVVKTKDIPERNIDESRIRSLEVGFFSSLTFLSFGINLFFSILFFILYSLSDALLFFFFYYYFLFFSFVFLSQQQKKTGHVPSYRIIGRSGEKKNHAAAQ